MFVISKEFTFSAAHSLPSLPPGHPCREVHGHNYTVRVVLRSEDLDQYGMVLDYGELDRFAKWLKLSIDHRNLNDIWLNPTAENIARHLHNHLKRMVPEGMLAGVEVRETDKTMAYYTEERSTKVTVLEMMPSPITDEEVLK